MTLRYGLENGLRQKTAAIWKARDPTHGAAGTFFERYQDYQWRVYDLDSEARAVFYVQDIGAAKFHSKAKTKQLRHALIVHICEQGCLGREGENWCTQLPARALRFGTRLSDFMDSCDQKIARFVQELTVRLQGAGATSSAHLGRATARQTLQQLFISTEESFCQLPADKCRSVLLLAGRVLRSSAVWVDSATVLQDNEVKQSMQGVAPNEQLQRYVLAARLLVLCSLASAGLSPNAHGTPKIFSIKRVLSQTSPRYAAYVNVLTALDCPVSEYRAKDKATAEKPAQSSDLMLPSELEVPESVRMVDLAAALKRSAGALTSCCNVATWPSVLRSCPGGAVALCH